MPRAALRIQKIIQVTKPTATIDVIASNSSCVVNDLAVSAVMNCSSAQPATATRDGRADTDPDQRAGRDGPT